MKVRGAPGTALGASGGCQATGPGEQASPVVITGVPGNRSPEGVAAGLRSRISRHGSPASPAGACPQVLQHC